MKIAHTATNTSGVTATGTSGTTLENSTSDQISSNEFLDLMMDELTHQDPTSADSSDPTAYLTQLAQITSVEQEEQTTNAENLKSAMSMIGDTVTYTNSLTGAKISGTVGSVQVSDNTPTLTVAGIAGITLGSVTNVAPASSSTTTSTSSS